MVRRISELLDRAAAAQREGLPDAAARLYDEAAALCREADDLDAWAKALLGAASVHLFGAEPGKLPAHLHEVFVRTKDDATRARLAAALARTWGYAGRQDRGVPFAEEALALAEAVGDPALIAECLDAALAVHWGPDELEGRRGLASRLDAVAAHVPDPDARLKAHLWGLQVACDLLDLHAIHRNLRALELLGEESPRALFFAASRRVMLDLLRGRTDTSAHLLALAAGSAKEAGLSDAWMVLEALRGYTAVQRGDRAVCAEVAAHAEEFALAEGITEVCAEAAYLWACSGRLDRAALLVATFQGSVLDDLPRDVNWLLVLQCVLEAALAVGDREVIETGARLLTPYAGRAVFNAGAVMFHGLTDDTLARAAAVLGDPARADELRARALASYERLGATWWRERLSNWRPPTKTEDAVARVAHLRPATGGLWVVGSGASPAPLRALRGFGYLRELVRRPGRELAALDLVGGGTGVVVESGLGETIDRQAVTAYRRRLAELQEEIDEAESWSDIGRRGVLAAERDALLDELARSAGLGGRPRESGSSAERARVAVQKAVAVAIDRIAEVDEPLARHLRSSVHTGRLCSYDPDPDARITWVLDEGAASPAKREHVTLDAPNRPNGGPEGHRV